MSDETASPEKELTPREKLHEGTKKYWAAMDAKDFKLAAEIYKEYKLPYSATH